MVRIAYALGMLALAMSGFVGFVAALDWSRAGPRFAEIQEYLGPAGALREGADALTSHSAEASPLIVQAQALAHYLNPPVSSETRASTISTPATNLTLPSLPSRPTAPSAKFRLYGTSCYPNQPSRSMALISEIGSAEGSERWVKEGFQVGHFIIHEIRQDGIVYRDGDQLQEMAVEAVAGPTSIVQDIRPGSLRVSAAVEDVGIGVPTPAGPNNIETSGNRRRGISR